MIYKLLADITVITHFLWILFLIFGALLGTSNIRWNKVIRIVHITGLISAFIINFLRLYCPLTYLEQWARLKSGSSSYTGSFITYYLEKLIYPNVSENILFLLTFLLCSFNIYFYVKYYKKKS